MLRLLSFQGRGEILLPCLLDVAVTRGGEGGVRGGIAVHTWVGSPGGSTGVGRTARETQQAGGLRLETPQGWGLAPSARIPEIRVALKHSWVTVDTQTCAGDALTWHTAGTHVHTHAEESTGKTKELETPPVSASSE